MSAVEEANGRVFAPVAVEVMAPVAAIVPKFAPPTALNIPEIVVDPVTASEVEVAAESVVSPCTRRFPVVVAPPEMVRPPVCVPSPIVVEAREMSPAVKVLSALNEFVVVVENAVVKTPVDELYASG